MRPSYEEWMMAALIKYGVGNKQVWQEKVDYRSSTYKTGHISWHTGITQEAVDWLKTRQEKKCKQLKQTNLKTNQLKNKPNGL